MFESGDIVICINSKLSGIEKSDLEVDKVYNVKINIKGITCGVPFHFLSLIESKYISDAANFITISQSRKLKINQLKESICLKRKAM